YPTLRIEKNDLRSVTLLEAKAKVKDIAISRERITLKDVLQEGTFGRIFHGILVDEKDPNKEKQAFVKTVKDQASEIQVTMMLTESCKLRGLHHRNLLPITNVCIEEGEKPMVILPYMNWGNLKLFLRQCKLVEANNPQAISQQDLVHMAIQIACGMSYLARREVIHKDLAARNCVIDDTLQVKITDNALSRDLFPMDYHCLGDSENRWVRWTALESLVNNEFSSASDVKLDEKDSDKEQQAFVKTVRDQASEIQVTTMLPESCKLRDLHHRNLPITHCKYVEANSPQATSQQKLVHMAAQIACGMSYLVRRKSSTKTWLLGALSFNNFNLSTVLINHLCDTLCWAFDPEERCSSSKGPGVSQRPVQPWGHVSDAPLTVPQRQEE
ncbi:hypothetical protein Celaphus_00012947, partial [Cervus elaphus hippelaphus]